MGLDVRTGAIPLLNAALRKNGWPLAGLRMLELGNQQFRRSIIGAKVPAKRVFELFGVEHTSIDINGKDGALALDLSQPILDETLMGHFDLVTNFGTTEHVSDQLAAWRNIHGFVRVDGLVLSVVPHTDFPPGHCEYYYHEKFFEALCEHAGYAIEEMYRTPGKHLAATLRRGRAEFQSEKIRDFLPEYRPGTGSPIGLNRRLHRWRKKLHR